MEYSVGRDIEMEYSLCIPTMSIRIDRHIWAQTVLHWENKPGNFFWR